MMRCFKAETLDGTAGIDAFGRIDANEAYFYRLAAFLYLNRVAIYDAYDLEKGIVARRRMDSVFFAIIKIKTLLHIRAERAKGLTFWI